MALFGRDYDQEFGYGYGPMRSGGPTAQWGRTPPRTNAARWNRGYNRDFGFGGAPQYGADYGRGAYDRGYKSRWQTDYGDPFGDRAHHTPMRTFYENDRSNRAWETRYDREYNGSPFPFGYRPYSARHPYDTGYNPRTYRPYGPSESRWF